MRSAYVAFVAFLALGTGACGILASDTFTGPALIISISPGHSAQIIAPDSVARGAGFQVSVRTIGGGCTREIGRTLWNVSGRLVEIRPYNKTRQSGACYLDIIDITHTIRTRIDQAGPATIRVYGEEGTLENTEARRGNTPAILDRAVTVY